VTQPLDETTALGYRDKDVGADVTRVIVLPPRESLQRLDAAACEVNDRLEPGLDPILPYCIPQADLEPLTLLVCA
jgi:hypothetical protein